MRKILIYIFVTLSVIFFFGIYKYLQPTNEVGTIKINGAQLTTPQAISNFKLTDNNGRVFSKENFKGHWTLLFFGFTNCGMVCPTTLAALNQMYVSMAKEMTPDQLPSIVMVSVDPERDSAARMNEYVHSFNSNFIGLRGNLSQTLSLEKQFHIAAAKFQAAGQGKDHYTINHSAEIIVINPDAKIEAYLSYPHQPEQMIKDFEYLSNYKASANATNEKPMLHDAAGHPIAMNSTKGQWIVINYWASWCDTCVEEVPELNRFYANNHAKDVVLLGVSYDPLSKSALQDTVNKMKIKFPVIAENPNTLFNLGTVEELPVTFIVNPKGEVAKKIIGSTSEASLNKILTTLKNSYA